MATRRVAGKSGVRMLVGKQRDFVLLQTIQTGSGVQKAFHRRVTGFVWGGGGGLAAKVRSWPLTEVKNGWSYTSFFNSLNAELNPICHVLELLGAHHILHVGRIRVKEIYYTGSVHTHTHTHTYIYIYRVHKF